MLKDRGDFAEEIMRIFPEESPSGEPKSVLTFTFQVTTDCSLCCTYCYQTNKGHEMMTWDVAKAAIDYAFDSANDHDSIFSYDFVSGIIVDFIGGEPLLNIDLVTQIIDYFEEQLVLRDSPWLFKHRYSFSTNGVAYFDDKVQSLLAKYGDLISMGVTVDGHKELHDKCRVFCNGHGSYDLAIKASLDQKNRFGNDSTKITLCPENIDETSRAIIHMLNLGYRYIHANCVFEEGWEPVHARTLYQEMKQIGDYILDNDLEDSCYVSLFGENDFSPLTDEDTSNWCGGVGSMIAVDYKGDFYPCIRYMESSIGKDRKPLIIGNIHDGAYKTAKTKKIKEAFSRVTRQSQSEQSCIDCPIASGCAWCSGYNYQKYGTVNKRATFICVMHKARALGSWYYFKKEAKKKGADHKIELFLPENDAIALIGEKEWSFLCNV